MANPDRPFKMQDMTEEYLSRPMTATEKHKLTADLKELPEDKLSRVLQIISETVCPCTPSRRATTRLSSTSTCLTRAASA